MKLTAGQAAKEAGVSVPTITRAIANGKITAEKLDNGKGYLIDPAELFRVFARKGSNSNATPSTLGDETPIETGVLEVEIKLLRERLADKDGVIADLREDRDKWREMAERTTKLLPPPSPETLIPPAPAVAERGGLIARLFGRGKS
ncbi:helix-turn-helix domain-containing protein [Roseomonas sp. CECT 9278]|uniref:helix-turn-helix domain-containing protein n=1 Tax=Roseomonas sp. CECT 9278 TaxID=2845823 RepID=UPI001E2E331F|nr:helix-turn-helix domain-containing protein [Roseomonas sp. CECT 9278]CAH0313539.1 hypothetical protein ROS9278_05039 [Roseomonas sp. CECT 9278]